MLKLNPIQYRPPDAKPTNVHSVCLKRHCVTALPRLPAVITGSNVTVETGAGAQALGVSGEVDRGEKGRRTAAH